MCKRWDTPNLSVPHEAENTEQIFLKLYYRQQLPEYSHAWWFDGNSWLICSDYENIAENMENTGYTGYMKISINDTTAPSLNQLGGTVFAIGTRTYIITVLSDKKGDIAPSGTVSVNHGANRTFTITPGKCYGIEDVLIDGVSVGAGGSYTFENITQDHTIEAVFRIENYTVTADAGQGGTISPSGSIVVCHKSDKIFTITPDPGYATGNVSVDNNTVTTFGNSYTFKDINSDHTIKATFSNNAPVISDIDDRTVKEDESTGSVSFTIDDSETLPEMLTLSASSSNPVLVNSSNIFFSGAGKERNISVFPAENESGEATIKVTVTDIAGETADTYFTLTVEPVNDKPTVENSSFTTDEDIEFTGTLSSDDADGDTLTFIIVEHAKKGLAKINSQTGEFTYIPNVNENGTDTFTFKVSDGQTNSDTASVTITVDPVNDWPVADAGQDQDVACGTSVSLDGSYSFDIEGEITYQWSQVNDPTVTLLNPKTVNPVFDSPDTISDLEFQLTVTDEGDLKSTDTVTIHVLKIIRVGDINGDKNVDLQDVILTLKVLAGISDNDIYIEAEVNGDGKIGTEELIYMLQVISGSGQD